jgi:hypothetical protein
MGNTSSSRQSEGRIDQRIGEEVRYLLSSISDDTTEVIVTASVPSEEDIRLLLEPSSSSLLPNNEEASRNDQALIELDGTSAPRIWNMATGNDAIVFCIQRRLPAWMKDAYLIGPYGEKGSVAVITGGRRDARYEPEAVPRGWRVWLAVPGKNQESAKYD